MLDEKDEEMRNAIPRGLDLEQARELKEVLTPAEWEGLGVVQNLLTDSPVVTPDEGFAARVMARLETRERERARQRAAIGALVFAAGALLVTLFVAFSWLPAMPNGAETGATIVKSLIALVAYTQTVVIILRTFFDAVLAAIGDASWLAVVLAFFALGLALIWVRLIGSAPSSRPIHREA